MARTSSKTSAGILLVRCSPDRPEFLLAHPGGPFFTRKDEGAWTIPKGLVEPGEDRLAAACREFCEETGQPCPAGPFEPLGSVTQGSGKVVYAWAVIGDCDTAQCKSNLFEVEWPPRSGRKQSYPELDRFEFFTAVDAVRKLIPAQAGFIHRAEEWLLRRA
jgi:predicted NUDIX family NTP pyrophosphohydrolase